MARSQKLCQGTRDLCAGSFGRTPLDAHSSVRDVRNVKTIFCMVNSYFPGFFSVMCWSLICRFWGCHFLLCCFHFFFFFELTFGHWVFTVTMDTNTIPHSRWCQLPFPTVSTECQYNSVVNIPLAVQSSTLYNKVPMYFVSYHTAEKQEVRQ